MRELSDVYAIDDDSEIDGEVFEYHLKIFTNIQRLAERGKSK